MSHCDKVIVPDRQRGPSPIHSPNRIFPQRSFHIPSLSSVALKEQSKIKLRLWQGEGQRPSEQKSGQELSKEGPVWVRAWAISALGSEQGRAEERQGHGRAAGVQRPARRLPQLLRGAMGVRGACRFSAPLMGQILRGRLAEVSQTPLLSLVLVSWGRHATKCHNPSDLQSQDILSAIMG